MATKFDNQKITEDLYAWGCLHWVCRGPGRGTERNKMKKGGEESRWT